MKIKDSAQQTNLSAKTIRYYEEINLLPPPIRLKNEYRNDHEADIVRIKFVVGVQSLNFTLDVIQEILSLRDRREAPCRVVLDLINKKANEITKRIAEL
jgi:DNA-binding transcriptional MerR regulator